MPVVVHAVPEPEYMAWVEKKKAEPAAAAGRQHLEQGRVDGKGKEVYEKNCVVCHQPDGQGIPPAFPALAGSKIVNGPLLDPEAS